MSLKLFCNVCHNFIREATAKDVGKLTGEEICPDCMGKTKDAYDAIEKSAHRTCRKIDALAQKGRAELELIMARVMKREGGE